MKRAKVLLFSCVIPLSLSLRSQYGEPVDTKDGPSFQIDIPTKRLIPYEYVREADLIWSTRVWRCIDLREKINHSLLYPFDDITRTGLWIRNNHQWSLWTIIRQHVLNGDLRVFSPYNPYDVFGEKDGDQLKYPIDPAPGKNYYTDPEFRKTMLYYLGGLGTTSTVEEVDEMGEKIIIVDSITGIQSFKYPPPDTVWFTSKDIIQNRLKEDWFFDKERSVMDVRIIAIAPVVYDMQMDSDGKQTIVGTRELFWLYFPHCRFVFNNYFAFNDKNDAQRMSYDDVFWKRRFNAVAYKESNTFDRKIEVYRSGIDALYEAERIKEEIRIIEHDVWDY